MKNTMFKTLVRAKIKDTACRLITKSSPASTWLRPGSTMQRKNWSVLKYLVLELIPASTLKKGWNASAPTKTTRWAAPSRTQLVVTISGAT